MKTTLKDKWDVESKMKKLTHLSLDEAIKLIYAWVKQDVINYGVFRIMLDSIKEKKQ